MADGAGSCRRTAFLIDQYIALNTFILTPRTVAADIARQQCIDLIKEKADPKG